MNNIGELILKKCGWKDEQLNFLGTMVYNIETNDGNPIADIVSNRTIEIISVEWFVPNKDGEKIGLVYSLLDNKIVQNKTDSEIKEEKDIKAFLDNIENTISGTNGTFFPKSKIPENKNKFIM